MHIFITGATGLIGRNLCQRLEKQHKITALVRNPTQTHLANNIKCITDIHQLSHQPPIDAIINLAGEPIFARRWTTAQKQKLCQSRLALTQKIVDFIQHSPQPPQCFISASATGYYPDSGEQRLTENTSTGSHFTAQLCQQWERIARQANCRTCFLRTGMVFSKQQGAFARIKKFYDYGLGGKLGSGQQSWSWIALEDMLNAILFLLEHTDCQDAFNLTAPQSIRNAEFNRQVSQWLKRPAIAHLPAPLLTLLLGERASLLLDSLNVYPEKLLKAGFQFQYPTLQDFLIKHQH